MPFQKGHKLGVGNKYKLGIKHTDKWKENARKRMLGNTRGFVAGKPSPRKGKKAKNPVWNKGKKIPEMSGINHPRWIKDRSLIKGQNRKDNPLYKKWRRSVWERDGFMCRLSSSECKGRIEAHHIVRWSENESLRYDVSNGITLCHHHHPRKKSDEKLLEPIFRQLVWLLESHLN